MNAVPRAPVQRVIRDMDATRILDPDAVRAIRTIVGNVMDDVVINLGSRDIGAVRRNPPVPFTTAGRGRRTGNEIIADGKAARRLTVPVVHLNPGAGHV